MNSIAARVLLAGRLARPDAIVGAQMQVKRYCTAAVTCRSYCTTADADVGGLVTCDQRNMKACVTESCEVWWTDLLQGALETCRSTTAEQVSSAGSTSSDIVTHSSCAKLLQLLCLCQAVRGVFSADNSHDKREPTASPWVKVLERPGSTGQSEEVPVVPRPDSMKPKHHAGDASDNKAEKVYSMLTQDAVQKA